jgi:flagellar biosynthesis/type III secretory pathway chaperone
LEQVASSFVDHIERDVETINEISFSLRRLQQDLKKNDSKGIQEILAKQNELMDGLKVLSQDENNLPFGHAMPSGSSKKAMTLAEALSGAVGEDRERLIGFHEKLIALIEEMAITNLQNLFLTQSGAKTSAKLLRILSGVLDSASFYTGDGRIQDPESPRAAWERRA